MNSRSNTSMKKKIYINYIFLIGCFLIGSVWGFFIRNEQAEAFMYIQTRFFPFYIDLELSEIVF